jgi:hypothetical protein
VDNTRWYQTNDKQYVYADEKGKILAKINLRQHYWEYGTSEYITLGHAKAAVEADPKLDKHELPWHT